MASKISHPLPQEVEDFGKQFTPEEVEKRKQEAAQKLSELEQAKKDFAEKAKPYRDQLEELEKGRKPLEDAVTKAQEKVKTARDQLKKIGELTKAGKLKTKEDREAYKEKVDREVKAAEAEVAEAEKKLDEFNEKAEEIQDKIKALGEPVDEIQKKVNSNEKLPESLARRQPVFEHAYCDKSIPHVEHGGLCPECHKDHSIERNDFAIDKVAALHSDLARMTEDVAEFRKAQKEHKEKQKTAPDGAKPPELKPETLAKMKQYGLSEAALAELGEKGKMLGTLVCVDERGNLVVLKSFSGADMTDGTSGEWAATDKVPNVKSFDTTKPAREYTEAEKEGIESPAGNCAAQKLMRAAIDYSTEQPKKWKKESEQLDKDRKRLESKLKEMLPRSDDARFKTGDDFTSGVQKTLQANSPELTGTAKEDAARMCKELEDVLARSKALEKESKVDVNGALQDRVPKLVPLAIAEAWVGGGNDGWPKKTDGHLYESCLTCRQVLGDVMCGLDKLKADNADLVKSGNAKMNPSGK